MIDRNKVINGLMSCAVKQNCSECPWEGGNTCLDRLHLAALELLKDEPLKVLDIVKFRNYHGYCPNCGERIHYIRTKYCPYCGRAIKWK